MVKISRKVVEDLEVEVLEFEDTVETVEKASLLSGYPPEMIVKTLLLKACGTYLIAIVRGDRRIDYDKALRYLGSRPALANPAEVLRILGLEAGAVTPLNPLVKNTRVILDPAITAFSEVVCGGGSKNVLFKLRTKDLVDYLRPEIADIFK